MKASRKRPKGAFRRLFGLVLCVVTAMPNSVGHQDLAALIARQPAVTERWRAHVRNSTFGTVHAASLSFPRLIGASIPDPYFTQLAALDPRALEATGSIPLNVPIDPVISAPVYDFPVVERRLKGDRLTVKSAPPQPEPAQPQISSPPKSKDMASRPPLSEPLSTLPSPSAPDIAVSQAALPKGNRLAPSQTESASDQIYRRAGLAPGQDTEAKRALRTPPRQPVIVASPAPQIADKVLRRASLAAGQDTLAKRELGIGPRRPVMIAAPAEPLEDTVLRRAGLAAGQDTLAKRKLGIGPRRPVMIAAPAEPVAGKVLRRAGLAAGQDTLAKRELGIGPRAPTTITASPAEPAPAPVASVEPQSTEATPKPHRRAGLAAEHINQMKNQPKRMSAPAAESADFESARADLKGPLVLPRAHIAETADLESQRADLAGPIVPPAPLVAEAPAAITPALVPDVAQLPPALEKSVPEQGSQIAESAAAPDAQVAVIEPQPERAPAVIVHAAPALEKTPDRLNAHVVEQLGHMAKPGAQTRIFFGTREMGVGGGEWEAWEPDEAPTVLAPPHVDTEIKRAALDPAPDAETETGGETIAPKGEVTGEGKRPRTPAERLNLVGAARGKHARCLANAIYFEARGEVERGQMAVAQVILNRAFSGYYPGNVCDVVYQNAHRHLACQFTFACDNHKDVVRDQKAWEVATRISDDALDGKFWLPEVGKATHYHATYVNPWWVRTMTKHTKLGIHIFYRPTRWGSLEDIPVWGDRLEVTGSIKREAGSAAPEKTSDDKRADVQPAAPARRSIFDPVEPITPGG
jgi:spore germination cell wall hydrolase CwlJ-like protein